MDGMYCPTGDGGNSAITNQDEAAILKATVAAVPVRTADLGREDDSHVVIGFRDVEITEA